MDLALAQLVEDSIIIDLLTVWLDPRTHDGISKLEAAGLHEHLTMPWVSLISESIRADTNDAIEDAALFVTVR